MLDEHHRSAAAVLRAGLVAVACTRAVYPLQRLVVVVYVWVVRSRHFSTAACSTFANHSTLHFIFPRLRLSVSRITAVHGPHYVFPKEISINVVEKVRLAVHACQLALHLILLFQYFSKVPVCLLSRLQVPPERVVSVHDVSNIYHVPLLLLEQSESLLSVRDCCTVLSCLMASSG